MRLLDTYTGQFVEKDPTDNDTRYAILSHTWDKAGEQNYKELKKIQERHDTSGRFLWRNSLSPIWKDAELSPKIRDVCAYARADGFRYIWIDSCCIDKTSSSELSEAINSMYAWYGQADVCYAYLADVPTNEDHEKDGSCFRKSRWFTRGWTLQELLAPRHLVFLSENWKLLGSKFALMELVHRTTNVSPEALLEPRSLDKFSVAQRLSWAAKRETTRVEDRAYSLLGIFDISIPILYGEGERAFRRLQEEIMRRIPDQTLFAWLDVEHLIFPPSRFDKPLPGSSNLFDQYSSLWVLEETQPRHVQSLLAPSLDRFADGGRITTIPHEELFQRFPGSDLRLPAPDYAFTPLGIRTQLPIIPFTHIVPSSMTNSIIHDKKERDTLPLAQCYLVVLGCEQADNPGSLLGRVCCIPPSKSGIEFLYCGFVEVLWRQNLLVRDKVDLFPLSADTLARCAAHVELRTVYICHPSRPSMTMVEEARYLPHKPEVVHLLFSDESRGALLRVGGYAAHLERPSTDRPRTHRLTLTNLQHTITVECQQPLQTDGRELTVTVDVSIVLFRERKDDDTPLQRMDTKRLAWTDSIPWAPTLWDSRGVSLDAGEEARVRVIIRLDFVATNLYVLHVDVRSE